jgi:hypothetical protein
MFLGDWVAEEHKDSPYVPQPADIHQLDTSISDEHKKNREMNAFSVVTPPPKKHFSNLYWKSKAPNT